MPLRFLLFVLNFSNLIVPFVLRIQLPVDVLEAAEESLQLVQGPPGADLVRLLRVAVAVAPVVHVVPRVAAATTAAVDAVRVGRRLSVAEVARMPTPTDSSGHSRLLDRLADHHAVLLELLGEDRVEERIAAAVEGKDEHREDFRRLQGDQTRSPGRCEGKEGDGEPADEVGEDEQGHPFRDPGVVGVPRLGAADGAVHLEVAAHQDEEGDSVDHHEEDDVALADSPLGLKRKTDGELSVVGDAEEREGGHEDGEGPGADHDVGRVLQTQPLVQVHRVRDCVVPLHCDLQRQS